MELYNISKQRLFTVDTTNSLGSGGEGVIYPHPTDKTKVVKIYHDNIKPTINNESINDLKSLSKFFIKPLEIYYDRFGATKAFSMDKIDLNNLIPFYKLFQKSFCKQNNIDYKLKIIICENLIKGLSECHSNDIIIGDFNFNNLYVDDKGFVYYIDVDSFQTKHHKHSNIVLDDVRDFLYFTISKESDYYALSVLIFYCLSFAHPFKGVHKTIGSIEGRVQKKISLLSNDKDLTNPAIYVKIDDNVLNQQFYKIFNNGERFLLNLSGNNIANIVIKPTITPTQTLKDGLHVQLISDNFLSAYATNRYLLLNKQNNTTLYSLSGTGIYTLVGDGGETFISDNHYIRKNNGSYNNSDGLIKNFSLVGKRFINESNIFTIDYSDIVKLYDLNKIVYGSVGVMQAHINQESIQFENGIIQNIGSAKWLVVLQDGYINYVQTDKQVVDFYFRKGLGIIKFIENNKNICKFFKLNGNKIVYLSDIDDLYFFDIKNDMIFVPKNKKILIYNNNFVEIATMDCDVIDEQTKLYHTNSGLIAINENVYLINKK